MAEEEPQEGSDQGMESEPTSDDLIRMLDEIEEKEGAYLAVNDPTSSSSWENEGHNAYWIEGKDLEEKGGFTSLMHEARDVPDEALMAAKDRIVERYNKLK